MNRRSGSRPSVQRYYFEESNNLQNEIIGLHEFVLPMSTAMWQFRSIIGTELQSVSPLNASQLATKYNTAPNTRGSTDLIRPFSTITWEEQRQRIAELALVNIIAIFEVWCDEICGKLGHPDLAIRIQFPTNASKTKGVGSAIDQITTVESVAIKGAIYPSLTRTKKYSMPTLDNLLRCFRYFKELRNSFMHRGRKCDGKLYGAQSEFLPVANEASLGMDFVPEHSSYQIGDSIDLSLHGVLGFTDVILRIVTTVDAELSRSESAQAEILRRIKIEKKTPIKRVESLRSVFNTFGIQGVNITPDLISLLRSNAVLR